MPFTDSSIEASTDNRLVIDNNSHLVNTNNNLTSQFVYTVDQSNSKMTYSNVANSGPSKEQAIVLNALNDIKIKDYIFAIGDLIGPKKIISASRISRNRVCIYLDSKATADNFTESREGIEIEGKFVRVKKLISPTKKIILSNVHTSIPNSILADMLKHFKIRTASGVHSLHIRLDRDDYKHISSFRRAVYIYDDENVAIPDNILLKYNNENHRIFLTNDELRCYICKSSGHTALSCTLEPEDTVPPDENVKDYEGNSDSALYENTSPSPTIVTESELVIPDQVPIVSIKAPNSAVKRTLTDSSSESSSVFNQHTAGKGSKAQVRPSAANKNLQKKSKNNEEDSAEPETTPPHSRSSSPVSIKILLNSIEENVNRNFKNKNYPLNHTNFSLLLDMTNSQPQPLEIVKSFKQESQETDTFISGILKMLKDNYALLQHRSMKIRFTKLQKRIIAQSMEIENESEGSINLT